MHEEVLSSEQLVLLKLLKQFSDEYFLIGGTAIALQLGHRRSIDFDLATNNDLNKEAVRSKIREQHEIQSVVVDTPGELTLNSNNVKLTFLKYPFNINPTLNFKDIINMPDIVTLAAMKALALGRRAKWKDYVDLFFVFKNFTLKDVVLKAEEIFKGEFNEKLFREQLSYFDDIDYTESIDFLEGFETQDKEIESKLKEISLEN